MFPKKTLDINRNIKDRPIRKLTSNSKRTVEDINPNVLNKSVNIDETKLSETNITDAELGETSSIEKSIGNNPKNFEDMDSVKKLL